jgi:pseudouridine-5'-phosphate glycosidase
MQAKSLKIAPEVADALETGKPVVALESTVIAHGLPYPANRDTALAMEAAVRDGGAIPATIAILGGEITVGLTEAQVEHLAQAENVRKCSRRDLPIVVGLGQDGATTVAGTMIVAHMAGIRVFATGGIGGVHQGQPFDISADLQELGRTPVAVVSSGAKSILDLPLTLEVLETQGVPIIGMGTDELPAFYTRRSGLPIDVRVDTPEDAASIVRAAHNIGAQHGILITVPVPEPEELQPKEAQSVIQEAIQKAEEQGVHGKNITPFVLERIHEITEGRSLKANRALLINNARTAAAIAKAL